MSYPWNQGPVPDGPGDLNSLNNPSTYDKKGWADQATSHAGGLFGAAYGLSDATDPPSVSVATVQARWEYLQAVASPGKALMSNGVGFLVSWTVSPLVEGLIEPFIGDPEQMRATAAGWEQVARWLDHVAETEPTRAQATTELWKGEAAEKFRAQMGEFGGGVTALAQDVREIGGILTMTADIFDMVLEFIIQMLTEYVIGLIIQWLAALAASWITAGTSVATATAATTASTATTGARIAKVLAQLQQKLGKLFVQLEKLMKRIRSGPLRQVVNRMDALRNGNRREQWLARTIDRRIGLPSILDRANPRTLASVTANRFVTRGGGFVAGRHALATNVAQGAASMVFGGSTMWGRAAWNAGVRTATDAAVKFGADAAYNTGTDKITGKQSDKERKQSQDKGFMW
ncbi:hypothetical protein Afil01_13160 [Actinorhabdospora filicis]|uniref:WXG100 family type VII secretion target n=1 Tax=Actinorhabdospora filicis TaxID=1785913 RepID=A0A9W6SJ50_9ACTN|nr:hypothetical protein [Actinorhabdospora filicis]GLZ76509.1 hypothetical protein Afil01_13160 [Actinorhabdospora filicis]